MTTVTMVLPADEPYSPAGGAIATVGDGISRAMVDAGLAMRVIAPPTTGVPYAGSLTPVDATRGLPGKALARVARLLGRPLADEDDRYHEAAAAAVATESVIVHNDPALAALVARNGHRVVLWLHNLVVDGEAIRAAVDAGVRLVAISRFVRDWTATTHGIDPDPVEVVYNTVDTDLFRPPDRWDPTDRLRVVIHGRIDPGKGQLLAARAVARARRGGVPVDLTVVGPVRTFGMVPDQVDAYVRDLRAAVADADATWDGPATRDTVPGLLRRFDVSLAPPTVGEPFSLAALEGMASGCATVAVPIGGLTEVVGDAALLVDPTPEALADALALLATDRGALASWRSRARERAMGFAWPGDGVERVLALLA